MADDALIFALLLFCVIVLAVRMVIQGGRISRLEGIVESMLMREKAERLRSAGQKSMI